MDEWKDRSLTHYEDERGGGHLAAYSQQASERDPLSSLSIPLLGTIKARQVLTTLDTRGAATAATAHSCWAEVIFPPPLSSLSLPANVVRPDSVDRVRVCEGNSVC